MDETQLSYLDKDELGASQVKEELNQIKSELTQSFQPNICSSLTREISLNRSRSFPPPEYRSYSPCLNSPPSTISPSIYRNEKIRKTFLVNGV